ncbi:hypothetical protein VKI21_02080 [Cyanobacterium aponinum UTEX 3222]|uniref:hypothetical protein n=1 Tax=Cyanobacterium aponinum TaxID=379064 RepID=UPI003090F030|nr:hypothetical protein VKI21_02080 [Cyanobacterium aponinum UTEX 3222]
MSLTKAIDTYLDIVQSRCLDELCCMVLPTPDNPPCNDPKPCRNYVLAKKQIQRSMNLKYNTPFISKLNDIADNIDALIDYLTHEPNNIHKKHTIGGYIDTIHTQIYELNILHQKNNKEQNND